MPLLRKGCTTIAVSPRIIQTSIVAMMCRLMLIALAVALLSPPANAAQATLETIRIGIPGKLMDFAPFFVGTKTGIYRSEGLEPQFIVMRSGIIISGSARR